MTTADATPQVWTVDELIDSQELQGMITPPFSADERSLAHAVAAAYFFWAELTEMSACAPRASVAFGAMCIGIRRVKERRAGRW
jgi:hypothetical protein